MFIPFQTVFSEGYEAVKVHLGGGRAGWQAYGLISPLWFPNQRWGISPFVQTSVTALFLLPLPPTHDFEGRDAPRSLPEHPKNSAQFPAGSWCLTGVGQTVGKSGVDIKGDFQTS